MGRGGYRPGAGRKGKNQTKSNSQLSLIKEVEPKDMDKIVEVIDKINSYPPEYRPYLYDYFGFKPTTQKWAHQKTGEKKAEKVHKAYYHYFEDTTLFKLKYCHKVAVTFQEDVIREIELAISDGIKIIIVVLPKRHGKTEGIVQPILLKHITFFKNDSHKYCTESGDLAEEKIQPIRDMLATDPDLNRDFGPFRTTKTWKKDKIEIERSAYSPDPTLQSWGLDVKFVGANSDFLVVDDIMNADMSETVRKNVHDRFFGELLNTRNPKCPTIVIMTRKHWEDLVAWFTEERCPYCPSSHRGTAKIIDKHSKAIIEGDYKNPSKEIIVRGTYDPEDSSKYEVLAVNRFRDNDDTYTVIRNEERYPIDFIFHQEFKVLWKEKWTEKILLNWYWTLGETSFDREYQNDPTAMSGRVFQDKWIQFHTLDTEGFMGGDWIRYITFDLALSEKETADYTGMVRVAYNKLSKIFYVDKISAEHQPLENSFLDLVENADSFRPVKTIVEAIGMFEPLTKNWQKATHHNIHYIKKKQEGKQERIAGTLQPIFQNGRIFIRKEHKDLIDELRHFGKTNRDHLVDALQQLVQDILTGGSGVKFRYRKRER